MTHDPSEAELAVDRADAVESREAIRQALDWRPGVWGGLDLETTGLSDSDRICEVAVVRVQRGKVLSVWSSLVNPGFPIPPEATSVHGITDAMVAGAPKIEELREEIQRQLADVSAVVAYNLYGADEGWIDRELPGILGSAPRIDPLVIVRDRRVGRFWKSEHVSEMTCPLLIERREGAPRRKSHGRHALSRAAYELRCDGPEVGFEEALHRAAWDALLAVRILWSVIRWCGPNGHESETKLRHEAARYQGEISTFKARMVAEDQEKVLVAERRRAQELAVLGESIAKRLIEHFGPLWERLEATLSGDGVD